MKICKYQATSRVVTLIDEKGINEPWECTSKDKSERFFINHKISNNKIEYITFTFYCKEDKIDVVYLVSLRKFSNGKWHGAFSIGNTPRLLRDITVDSSCDLQINIGSWCQATKNYKVSITGEYDSTYEDEELEKNTLREFEDFIQRAI